MSHQPIETVFLDSMAPLMRASSDLVTVLVTYPPDALPKHWTRFTKNFAKGVALCKINPQSLVNRITFYLQKYPIMCRENKTVCLSAKVHIIE